MVKLTVRYLQTLKEKTLGLIGEKSITPIYFETRWGIHTFGVREPIDVVILDANSHIVCLKIGLKPNRIFLWNPKYKRILELPKGTIKNKRLALGAKLSFRLSK